nr:IS982 family transposase [Aliterella atlantica]
MSSLEELFCQVDDFCKYFEPQWHMQLMGHGLQTRRRARGLCLSEIITILIGFHQHHYRNFKHYYINYVSVHWQREFPRLPSYQRFVEWMPSTLIPLCVYLTDCFSKCTGISFIDATSLRVCHNRRINQHRVFNNLAARGKTSVDWFFGFKLHLVVNELGELLNVQITPGNIDERKPVPGLLRSLFGKVFADRGYVSRSLAQKLLQNFGIEFFAQPRRNMKNRLMRFHDKLLSPGLTQG